MEDEYNIDPQDSTMSELNRSDVNEIADTSKEFGEAGGYDESYEDEEGGNSFRGRGGRGNFRGRGRGPPPGWMNGPPPMRFRGRGYGPGGPPMRGRGFFRGRGGPRYGPNNGPNYDNNWGPMGPPPPGMMGGPPPFGPPPGMMPPGGPMGPPPNMMGQPPPFGPPGMPPPNMPAPELWVETKSDEGKSYYYHARTRETTWTRPQESPTCKVITQAEVDVMTAAGQYPGMGQSMPMNGPMGGPPMGGPPMGMMPNGMMGMMPPGVGPHGPTPGSVPPFMNQPPPWVKDNHQMQSKMDSQESSPDDDAPPGEAPVQPTQPPGTGPGAGAGWGWGWAPPMVAQPPGLAAVPDAGAATQPQTGTPAAITEALPTDSASTPKKEEIVIPPELSARASEWTTHRAPDGRPYYYHAASSQSVWEKPQPLKEFDDLQNKIAKEKGEKIDNKKDKRIIDDGKIEVIDVEAHAEAVAAAEAAAEAAERERVERERMERERAEKERAEKERVEKEKLEKEKAKTDKSRPVSSTPISGTPWCVVWTGDGRVFFYNPTARLSVWERPAQLAGRTDVDQAVAHPPHQRDQQRKETPTVATTPTKSSNGELKRGASDTSDSDSEPAKKAKQEEAKKKPAPPPGVIDMGKEAAMEAEARAARERALVPFEQRVRAFLQMLHESDVSAFSPWEKELHKIVFDSRYLLLESKERKQVFDKYVRERAEEERKEKKNRIQQKKLAFRAVMEEAKLHSKSSFTEFSGKFSRDERFKSIEKMRDRETYFNEYIAEVRKKEKEEKDRKRELAKTEFITLLKEKSVDRHSRWLEVKKKIDSDARYKAVESSTMREDYFREYCKMVKEERKKEKDGKEKERERGSKKDKKDKDRDKEKEREKETKKDKKKEKTGDKQLDASTEDEKKQPTPPPDQWADILGIPGEEEEKESKTNPKTKEKKEELEVEKEETKSPSPEKEMLSPKQLRSSKKELPTEKKSPIKSPPKKRKQDFKSPEPETEKKGKKKAEKTEKPEKAEKTEKTEKRRRKKSEKEYIAIPYLSQHVIAFPHFSRHVIAFPHLPRRVIAIPHLPRRVIAIPHLPRHVITVPHLPRHVIAIPHLPRHVIAISHLPRHVIAIPHLPRHVIAIPHLPSIKEEAVSAPEGAPPCEEAKARAARAQASIKERERQVQRALATSLRDRDKEREYHKRDEAVQHFNALLADLVRNPDLTWREAKKQLKKDHRYSLAEELSKDDKERLFGQHIGVVSTKRRDKLRAVLSELGVGGAAAWRDVKERLREHPAAPQYKNAPQMEREFRDYQRDKQSNAKTALRQLLLETRAITHRSLAAVKEAPHALTALHDTLKHDARYIALEHIPEEREAIITSYLEELDKKGPPPPPTATEPSRRAKQ